MTSLVKAAAFPLMISARLISDLGEVDSAARGLWISRGFARVRYDVVTQYRAVFASDAAPAAPGAPGASAAPAPPVRPLAVPLPAGAKAGDVVGVLDAEGVAHALSVPPARSASAAPASTLQASAPAECSWGEPAAELDPNELAQGDALGQLLLSHWAAERVEELVCRRCP